MDDELRACLAWYGETRAPEPDGRVSETRDAFQAHLVRLLAPPPDGAAGLPDLPLLVAVLGEIGNNSFDHNLGHWRDRPGCRFGRDLTADPALFWIADRGRGVLASLRQALPALSSDQEALEIAYRRTVSGRAPERRGNGLKFVRNVVNGGARRGLACRSGDGAISLGSLGAAVDGLLRGAPRAAGVFTIVAWGRP